MKKEDKCKAELNIMQETDLEEIIDKYIYLRWTKKKKKDFITENFKSKDWKWVYKDYVL